MNHMRSKPNSFVRTTLVVDILVKQLKTKALCKYIEEFKFDRANVFSYSTEEGTTAAGTKRFNWATYKTKRAERDWWNNCKTTQESLEAEIEKLLKFMLMEAERHEYLWEKC